MSHLVQEEAWDSISDRRGEASTCTESTSPMGLATMTSQLSKRGNSAVESLGLPWRFAPRATYSPEDPSGLISFALAENALITEDVLEFARKHANLTARDFLYGGSAGGGPRFPSALAAHLNEYLEPHTLLTGDDIQITASATAMHDILAWAMADPGEGILTSRPVYGRFELDFGNKSQVKVVYSDTNAWNCFDESVVDKFEEALARSNAEGVTVKAVLIVNPHNPLGRCYPKNTLIAIMKFCQKHRLHLISDEIYACSVFPSPAATPFTSALALDSGPLLDPDRLHVTYGLSKDFGAAGLRVGALVSRSAPLRAAVSAATRFHNPSGASLAIATAMLEDRAWCRGFIDSSRAKLAAAHAHMARGLEGIGVRCLPGSNAGFFVWADFSPFLPREGDGEGNAEFALARRFREAGVFLHPGEEHALSPGWFRLVYTQHPDTVTEGLRRIKSVIYPSAS